MYWIMSSELKTQILPIFGGQLQKKIFFSPKFQHLNGVPILSPRSGISYKPIGITVQPWHNITDFVIGGDNHIFQFKKISAILFFRRFCILFSF